VRIRNLQLPAPKKRRRIWAAVGSTVAVTLLPSAVFQIVLYRQNLAAAHETFARFEPLQKRDRVLVISPHCDDELSSSRRLRSLIAS
jgi:hypothetical protein